MSTPENGDRREPTKRELIDLIFASLQDDRKAVGGSYCKLSELSGIKKQKLSFWGKQSSKGTLCKRMRISWKSIGQISCATGGISQNTKYLAQLYLEKFISR